MQYHDSPYLLQPCHDSNKRTRKKKGGEGKELGLKKKHETTFNVHYNFFFTTRIL